MGSTLQGRLAFPVGFLSRFQSKPHVPAEVCLRSFLRWLKGHLHYVQQMPANSPPVITEEGTVGRVLERHQRFRSGHLMERLLH